MSQYSFVAEQIWLDGSFVGPRSINCDGAIIQSVTLQPIFEKVVHLRNKAVLPGFVNAHSHAFQRCIRGLVQSVPSRDPSADFWSWRERMYHAALSLSADDFETVTRWCYLEMLLAGMTRVAEFHYVHHGADGQAYSDVSELGQRVMQAAQSLGIGLTLLPVAYQRGGFNRPAQRAQRRFIFADVQDFLALVERCDVVAKGFSDSIEVGTAIHSIRAVPRPWLEAIGAHAQGANRPLHIHGNEQPGEIEQSLAEYGCRPVELLAETGVLGPSTVLVHGIHLSKNEIALLGESGSGVCACPTTERDLGDGIIPARALQQGNVPLSLGSDSHVQIDFFAEMRALEGHERLARLKRCVLLQQPKGEQEHLGVAPQLLSWATQGGAKAVGIQAGSLEAGFRADFITVDLDDVSLWGWQAHTLDQQLVFSGRTSAVRDVFVGGECVVKEGRHPLQESIRLEAQSLMKRLWTS